MTQLYSILVYTIFETIRQNPEHFVVKSSKECFADSLVTVSPLGLILFFFQSTILLDNL